MARIMVVFAHPTLEDSSFHRRLLRIVQGFRDIHLNDLYERYPDFSIQAGAEQELLRAHDTIVLQFPLHWFATPALLKEWFDTVLTEGFAFGGNGSTLAGKRLALVITAGAFQSYYQKDRHGAYGMSNLLSPLKQMARFCGMVPLPPFVIYGCHKMELELKQDGSVFRPYEQAYEQLLRRLQDDQLDVTALAAKADEEDLLSYMEKTG